jgi:hypothetical protein
MKLRYFVALAACFTLALSPAFAGESDDDGAGGNEDVAGGVHAGAEIVSPINIASEHSLEFGILTNNFGSPGGTCIIDPADATLGSGEIDDSELTCVGLAPHPASGVRRAAVFSVDGGAGELFTLTISGTTDPPASGVITITADNSADTMTIDTLTVLPSAGGSYSPAGPGTWDGTMSGSNPGDGEADFLMGGTLHVDPGQVDDVYSGSFDAKVKYI